MTPFDVVTQATFSPVPLVVILVLGGWYLGSLHRLVARGEAWPAVRTASFCLAELSLAFGFVSGIAAYDRIFKVVAAQHILISIAAPIFLAVSAPITLALQAGSPRTRTTIERALHSRASQVLSHPKFTWTFYGLSLYVLYFTGLYAFALQHDAVHTLVHLECSWPAASSGGRRSASTPCPTARARAPGSSTCCWSCRSTPSWAWALESQSSPLAPGMSLADLHAGAGVMWVAGEIAGLLGTLVLFVLWLRADEQAAKRTRRGQPRPRPPPSWPTGGRPGTPPPGLTRVDHPPGPAGGARPGHAGPPPYAGRPFRLPVAPGRPAGAAETRASATNRIVQDPGGLQPHRPAGPRASRWWRRPPVTTPRAWRWPPP